MSRTSRNPIKSTNSKPAPINAEVYQATQHTQGHDSQTSQPDKAHLEAWAQFLYKQYKKHKTSKDRQV
jgi:hypothetical protein